MPDLPVLIRNVSNLLPLTADCLPQGELCVYVWLLAYCGCVSQLPPCKLQLHAAENSCVCSFAESGRVYADNGKRNIRPEFTLSVFVRDDRETYKQTAELSPARLGS